MSFAPSFDAKESVRQAIDIVELVGGYLQLRREGRNYKALCPWHDDSRPSLQINPDRQSFKCWVCDIGGDIFSFMMKMENVDFAEALAMLADRAGIELRPQAGGDRGGPSAADQKRLLYRAMAWAEQQYHDYLLKAPEAEPARRYLGSRGITAESIARYRLGYAPDQWEWLAGRARGTPISSKVLETVGLVARRPESQGAYDRFKGRVLFPIRDTQGRPVALGGRVLPEFADRTPAKYINSPETPLFSKSSMVYGLDLAREAVHRARNVIVMEGYTDCIVARQFGFENVVAVLGTALGERHIRLLRRFADTITLLLDGDEAGQKRTNEILELFVAQQVDLRILTLPDQLDPCDFLLARGAAALAPLLDGAVDALEHKIRQITRQIGAARHTHVANRGLEEMLATLAKAPRLKDGTETAVRLREQQMLGRLAREFSVPEEVLRTRLTDLRRAQGSTRTPSETTADPSAGATQEFGPPDNWERELLETLLLEPESVMLAAESVGADDLASPAGRRLFVMARDLASEGITPSFERLLLEFDEPAMKNLLVELDEHGRAKGGSDPAIRLRDLLAVFSRRRQDVEWRAQTAALKEGRLSKHDEDKMLQQLIEQQKSRQGI